jgi:superfamily II DNA or RNA helicase
MRAAGGYRPRRRFGPPKQPPLQTVAAKNEDAGPAWGVTGLSARGYSVPKAAFDERQLAALKKELTMVPCVPGQAAVGPEASFPIFLESAHKLYVPKYFGLQRFGAPVRGCTIEPGEPLGEAVEFTGRLRQEQRLPVRAFLDAARDPMRMGGILSLPCGFGKTIAALHIIAELGTRTLVVVHKDFLLNQWRERIREFLPAASVGLLKAKVVDVAGRDIVIASVQSLSMKQYGPDVFAGIGLLIIDECHRVGTEVFSRALHKTNVRYSLGLSATVERKDGMTKAFVHFLGEVLFKGQRREDVVDVVQHRFYDDDPDYSREETIGFGPDSKPNTARMINNVCGHGARNELLVDTIVDLLRREPGRKILVLSDRKAQLRAVKDGVEAAGVSAGFYWGGMKPAALAESETKRVMCATFPYAAEGMDVPDLDTLLLASPKTDIEQSCGRILRQKAESRLRKPLIFDVVDAFSPMFQRQAAKRRAFYKKHGYTIHGTVEQAFAGATAAPEDEDDDDRDDDPSQDYALTFVDDDECP